jgi:thiol-disulfide isomerase/thioredoxin
MFLGILRAFARAGVVLAAVYPVAAQTERIVRVDLAYQAPGKGPMPNFSPYGTQVKLSDLPSDAVLPEGAIRPAKIGTLQIGPSKGSWIKILVTADSADPLDLCRLYIDGNRNGLFGDDGAALTANPSMNEKTRAWWSSFSNAEISIPYDTGVVEPYTVGFWAVREEGEAPDVIRYSVRSWRSGTVLVDGVDAIVAVMDAKNNAVFGAKDKWSVLAASEKDAAGRVLSHTEALPMNRLMFVNKGDGKELVLEFRSLSPDGRSLTFAIVDRPISKVQDRAPDDTLAAERARPRAANRFPWIESDFERAAAEARESGRRLILDFWTSWCEPCKWLDDWIWTDADVAALLNAGYAGVRLDGDRDKDMASRFHVQGYPTVVVLDSTGSEIRRFNFVPSTRMLELLRQ